MSQSDEKDVHQEGRGRSAQKREAKAVEQLAQTLVDLPAPELGNLPMDKELAREVDLARNTKGHSSRKRQIKHLAGYLRRHDDAREVLVAAIEGQAVVQRQETMAFHHLEDLRDRLCDSKSFETTLAEVQLTYPHIDARKLTRLANAVHEHGDKKAAREIFRRLRQADEAVTP